MAYYLIKHDCGFGEIASIVEAESEEEAVNIAYEAWREDAENSAEYSAELATFENVSSDSHEDPADYGLVDPDEGE